MDPLLFLYTWRLSKGLTQKELAKRTGLTQAQISYVEHLDHAPSLKTLEKLAKGLELEIQDLFKPPFVTDASLSRHEIDEIAEAVISGERKLRREWIALADAVASLMSQKLNAYSAPGRFVNRGKRWGGKFQAIKVRRLFPGLPLAQVLARVDKKLT